MEQLISTKLVRTLQDASQTGADIDAHVLENEYGEFAKLVLSENADKAAFRNNLIFVRVELQSLTVAGKKRSEFSWQSH